MLWSIDSCLNKVSADQYHLTAWRAQVSTHRGRVLFEVIRWQVTSFQTIASSILFFYKIHFKYVVFISVYVYVYVYGPALLRFWFQTNLGREHSASYFKKYRWGRLFSVGCLWHSHGKNPVRLYPKLQSQPIGLRKIFIDYFFLHVDQSDCTKSVSIFNRFPSSEERWNQNVPSQICRPWVFPLVV